MRQEEERTTRGSLLGWRSPHLSVVFLELPVGIPLCLFQLLQPGPQLICFLLSCYLSLLKHQQLLLLLLLGPLKTKQATGWLDTGPRALQTDPPQGAAIVCVYSTHCPKT